MMTDLTDDAKLKIAERLKEIETEFKEAVASLTEAELVIFYNAFNLGYRKSFFVDVAESNGIAYE
jgi:predicted DNA binding protein